MKKTLIDFSTVYQNSNEFRRFWGKFENKKKKVYSKELKIFDPSWKWCHKRLHPISKIGVLNDVSIECHLHMHYADCT